MQSQKNPNKYVYGYACNLISQFQILYENAMLRMTETLWRTGQMDLLCQTLRLCTVPPPGRARTPPPRRTQQGH